MKKGTTRTWLLLVLAFLLAVLGLRTRLYLDGEFEMLVPEQGTAEVGCFDGVMIQAALDITREAETVGEEDADD